MSKNFHGVLDYDSVFRFVHLFKQTMWVVCSRTCLCVTGTMQYRGANSADNKEINFVIPNNFTPKR